MLVIVLEDMLPMIGDSSSLFNSMEKWINL